MLNSTKGVSTGLPPNNVNKMKLKINSQKKIFPIGLKTKGLIKLEWTKGKINKIMIEHIKARNPPNLLGIALKIA